VVGSYVYDRSAGIVWLEQRLMPGLGAVLLFAAALAYAPKRRLSRPALWSAAMGAGFVGFAFFRTTLVHFFAHAPWLGNLWEEGLEAVGAMVLLAWWVGSRDRTTRRELQAHPAELPSEPSMAS
jgi:hypothetical protein